MKLEKENHLDSDGRNRRMSYLGGWVEFQIYSFIPQILLSFHCVPDIVLNSRHDGKQEQFLSSGSLYSTGERQTANM